MEIFFGRLECRIPQITPEHRRHAQLMRLLERKPDLLNLALRFRGAEVNRRTNRHCPHVERLFHPPEEYLIVTVRVRKEFVVVEFEYERYLVGVFPCHRPEHP